MNATAHVGTATAQDPPDDSLPPSSGKWRSRAFGLDLEGDSPLVGLPFARPREGGRTTVVEVVPGEMLDRLWRGSDAETVRLSQGGIEGGRPRFTVDSQQTIGYRLHATGFGTAVVSPDGGLIRYATHGQVWRSHRFVLGRVLPFAAAVCGLEVFHASAVAIAGRALAFVGPSASGKSSIAVNLMLRGASFVTDDVLAVETGEDLVHAHPGPAVASVRENEHALIPEPARRRLGTMLDSTDGAYVAIAREERTLPLGALYVLGRGGGRTVAMRHLSPPDPRLLLASTFVFELRTAQRMTRQLDACARLAAAVPVFELTLPADGSAAEAAAAVEAHVSGIRGSVYLGR